MRGITVCSHAPLTFVVMDNIDVTFGTGLFQGVGPVFTAAFFGRSGKTSLSGDKIR